MTVIPAEAGIQRIQIIRKTLEPLAKVSEKYSEKNFPAGT
jgi:hypothetical protein